MDSNQCFVFNMTLQIASCDVLAPVQLQATHATSLQLQNYMFSTPNQGCFRNISVLENPPFEDKFEMTAGD